VCEFVGVCRVFAAATAVAAGVCTRSTSCVLPDPTNNNTQPPRPPQAWASCLPSTLSERTTSRKCGSLSSAPTICEFCCACIVGLRCQKSPRAALPGGRCKHACTHPCHARRVHASATTPRCHAALFAGLLLCGTQVRTARALPHAPRLQGWAAGIPLKCTHSSHRARHTQVRACVRVQLRTSFGDISCGCGGGCVARPQQKWPPCPTCFVAHEHSETHP
jgi:hypothetical protein